MRKVGWKDLTNKRLQTRCYGIVPDRTDALRLLTSVPYHTVFFPLQGNIDLCISKGGKSNLMAILLCDQYGEDLWRAG